MLGGGTGEWSRDHDGRYSEKEKVRERGGTKSPLFSKVAAPGVSEGNTGQRGKDSW